MIFNDLNITANLNQVFPLETESRIESPNKGFDLASCWEKQQIFLSRYDLEFVIAASAVLAFN